MFTALAALVAFLSGFTDVRIGDIQTVEIVIMGALALSFLLPRQAAQVEGPVVTINLLPRILVMLTLVACGSLLSLRLTFYPPDDIGLLKQPPWATIVRLIEVSISTSAVFIVALAIRDDPRKFSLVLKAYVWAGLLNAIWGLIAFAIFFGAGIDLPGITLGGRIPRVCGFFNEGGPFGVYMAGVALIQYIRGPMLGYIGKFQYRSSIVLMMVAIIGSQSKASVLVILVLALLGFAQQRRAALVAFALVLVVPLAIASNLVEGLNGYYDSLVNFREQAYERSTDGNLVNGRLMASVLLPRIVEAHPILGVGIGNYSLVRNNPNILLGLPRTEVWDLHGLGLLGYLAELGIPLTLFVLYIYAYPFFTALRQRGWIFMLSAYPMLAALFGVQLNFAYPWVVMGLALSAISIDRKYRATGRALVPAAPRSARTLRESVGRLRRR
ncbi:O-antigen ligase family protein [Sphingomonas sp. 1P08PE]|uniref:O-antigen ligase family protein n=1 Tax=Sphingomonas sp. 1P08PE TaxID=554122 RepID=UPI0039A15D48